MSSRFIESDLKGAFLIEGEFFFDARGKFYKMFEKETYAKGGVDFNLHESFVSVSCKNVIRGIHFQIHGPQKKIITVISGRAWDVIVDLRPQSPTFLEWKGYELGGERPLSVYIPEGFGHGFASLEDNTVMLYQCDGAYDKGSDTGIVYDDPKLNIDWKVEKDEAIISSRDLHLLTISEYLKNPIRV
ncbi:dTDP-4-dehydrorhamnose 3,5-epimerase [Lachnospiraceae bacterium G11]|nr:dTDP-4-dehydrorhamnose 3,5-epimerase [Lachnospiraceae bacterium G11]